MPFSVILEFFDLLEPDIVSLENPSQSPAPSLN